MGEKLEHFSWTGKIRFGYDKYYTVVTLKGMGTGTTCLYILRFRRGNRDFWVPYGLSFPGPLNLPASYWNLLK